MPETHSWTRCPRAFRLRCSYMTKDKQDEAQRHAQRDALKAQVRMHYRITRDEDYGALLSAALHEGILTKRVVSDREVYYLPGENMYEPKLDFGRL